MALFFFKLLLVCFILFASEPSVFMVCLSALTFLTLGFPFVLGGVCFLCRGFFASLIEASTSRCLGGAWVFSLTVGLFSFSLIPLASLLSVFLSADLVSCFCSASFFLSAFGFWLFFSDDCFDVSESALESTISFLSTFDSFLLFSEVLFSG